MEKNRRSLAKALSYRVFGTVTTFGVSLVVTGDMGFAGGIATLDFIGKTLLYYAHERIWSAISWGRTPPVS